MLKKLSYTHTDIEALIHERFEGYRDESSYTHLSASLVDLTQRLHAVDPIAYGRSRNFLQGQVTQLSFYISSGILLLEEVFDHILSRAQVEDAQKLIQELIWRAYFRALLTTYPELSHQDYQPYKTGYDADTYATELPEDVLSAQTPNAAINGFIHTLESTGYLHNHARMYLAAYLIHFRRVKWQVGAEWMHHRLIDADQASNHLSWQWVASTLSSKPYIFNLENLSKYASTVVDCSAEHNPELVGTYEAISRSLFKGLHHE